MTQTPGPFDRYLSLIELIALSRTGLRLVEIAELMNLPKPTVHRLLGVLVDSGVVSADEHRQRSYLPGPRLMKLVALGRSSETVDGFAQLVCDKLASQVLETCYIVRLGAKSAQTIAKSVPNQGYRLHVFPGIDLPSHAAASVKVILAFQTEDVRKRLLQEPLRAFTTRTVTDPQQIRTDLDRIKSLGFAVCDREVDPEVMAFACPVRLQTGVFYSVGVTGPRRRLLQHPREHWINALQAAASRFAAMLDVEGA